MSFNEMFRIYPNRNTELRTICHEVCEFGRNIAKEPSAAHSNGLDLHAIRRQRQYIEKAKRKLAAIESRPVPDAPITHDFEKPINLSDPYETFTQGVGGELVPINDACQLLQEKWMEIAVELARSQSAQLAGAIVSYDYERAINNVEVIEKMLNEIEEDPFLDLPETTSPATQTQRSGTATVAGSSVDDRGFGR